MPDASCDHSGLKSDASPVDGRQLGRRVASRRQAVGVTGGRGPSPYGRTASALGAAAILLGTLWSTSAHGRTWTLADGRRTLEGNFVSLDKGIVSLQTIGDEIRKVALEDLSDLDRDLAARLGEAAAKSIEVVVEGVGLTPAEALQSAFTQAVHEAVGARIKAKTVVENDRLAEDTVLVFSDGFVSRYDRVADRQEAGLCHVRIRAVVQKRDVTDKAAAAENTRDAKHLYAEAFTKVQRRRVAMAILQDAIDGFAAEILNVTLVGRNATEVIPDDLEHVRVRCDIRVKVDMDRYRRLVGDMIDALSALARNSGRFTTQTNLLKATDPAAVPIVAELEKQFLRPTEGSGVDYGPLYTLVGASPNSKGPDTEAAEKRETGSTVFYVCVPPTGGGLSAKSCAWRWFEIDGHPKLPAQRISTVVRYSDADGRTVLEESVPFGGRTPGLSASGRGDKLRTIVVSPFFLYHVSHGYLISDIPHAREVTIRKMLRLPLAALAQIHDERVVVAGEPLERQADFPEDITAAAAGPPVAGNRRPVGGVERIVLGEGTVEIRPTVTNGGVAFVISAQGFNGDPRPLRDWLASDEFERIVEHAVRSVARASGSWKGEWEPFRQAADGTVTVKMVVRPR